MKTKRRFLGRVVYLDQTQVFCCFPSVLGTDALLGIPRRFFPADIRQEARFFVKMTKPNMIELPLLWEEFELEDFEFETPEPAHICIATRHKWRTLGRICHVEEDEVFCLFPGLMGHHTMFGVPRWVFPDGVIEKDNRFYVKMRVPEDEGIRWTDFEFEDFEFKLNGEWKTFQVPPESQTDV